VGSERERRDDAEAPAAAQRPEELGFSSPLPFPALAYRFTHELVRRAKPSLSMADEWWFTRPNDLGLTRCVRMHYGRVEGVY
jgi:hypothetical protein